MYPCMSHRHQHCLCSYSYALLLPQSPPLTPLQVANSFDDAFTGCDYVIHTAAPYVANVTGKQGYEKLVVPALQGVENVLGAPLRVCWGERGEGRRQKQCNASRVTGANGCKKQVVFALQGVDSRQCACCLRGDRAPLEGRAEARCRRSCKVVRVCWVCSGEGREKRGSPPCGRGSRAGSMHARGLVER